MALHGLMILTAALAGEVPAPAGAAELVSAAAEGVGGGARDESYAPATARIVGGIIEYTRWPAQAGPLTLCAAGPTRRGGRLDAGVHTRALAGLGRGDPDRAPWTA